MPPRVVINLDRDTERLERFLALNAAVGPFQRFPAHYGRELDRAALARNGTIMPGLRYNDGALGNAISHVSLWRAVREGGEAMTVIEDDAVLAPHFGAMSGHVLSMLPGDWDLVTWGWNFDAFLWAEVPEGVSICRLGFSQDQLRDNLEAWRRGTPPCVPVRLRCFFGIMAYSISPRGAARLLDALLPLDGQPVPFIGGGMLDNTTVDIAMTATYGALRAYACFPPIAVSENRHETSHTVAAAHSAAGKA